MSERPGPDGLTPLQRESARADALEGEIAVALAEFSGEGDNPHREDAATRVSKDLRADREETS